jgi:hypothetical protein
MRRRVVVTLIALFTLVFGVTGIATAQNTDLLRSDGRW